MHKENSDAALQFDEFGERLAHVLLLEFNHVNKIDNFCQGVWSDLKFESKNFRLMQLLFGGNEWRNKVLSTLLIVIWKTQDNGNSDILAETREMQTSFYIFPRI